MKERFAQRLRRAAVQARLGLPMEEAGLEPWLRVAGGVREPGPLLQSLAGVLEQSEKLRGELRLALLYPRLVVFFIGTELLLFVPLVLQLQQRYPSALRLALAVGAVLMLGWLGRRWFGPDRSRHRWLQGLRWQVSPDQVTWCRALACLLQSGRSLPEAVELSLQLIEDQTLRRRLAPVADRLSGGTSLASALDSIGLEPVVVWACEAGEQTERLPAALDQAAEVLEQEIETRGAALLAWLPSVALGLCGLLVLLVLLLFWWNYQQLALSQA